MMYEREMALALRTATLSRDPSTQNGAVLFGYPLTADYNRFPTGVQSTPARWERPMKYRFVEHAERNTIYRAANQGVKTKGKIMVCPWAACSDCARAIVSAGIIRLVRFPMQNDATANHWHDECAIGDVILREGGIEVIEMAFNGPLPLLRRNGQIWVP